MDEIREISLLFRTVCLINRQIESATHRVRSARDETERHIWTLHVTDLTMNRDDTLYLIDRMVWK